MPSDSAITVGVRIRPLVSHEKGQQQCLRTTNGEVHIIPDAVAPQHAREGPFKFDLAMDSTDSRLPKFVSNATCYDLIGHTIVDHALEGYNSCLFCYGQTGTGKTTTILGDKQSGPGILISLFRELFEKVRVEEQNGCEIKVHVQMLEVYNEKVFDLLADEHDLHHHNQGHHKIELHVLPAGVQVKGAELKQVSNVEECLALIDHGNTMKHIAATAMNPQSSRGHTVFKLCIQKDDNGTGIHMGSEVYFADLAGHENEKMTQVKGDRLVELSFINKSLMWLQSAIHNLSKGHGKSHGRSSMCDFRNSKLTLLLSNALTGNSLVNVVVTLSPAEAHFATSLSSLKFANEVKRIKVEVTSTAHKDPAVTIKLLEQEVETLKQQLAAALAGHPQRSPDAGSAGYATVSAAFQTTGSSVGDSACHGVGSAEGSGAAPEVACSRPGTDDFERQDVQQLEHLNELQEQLEEQEEQRKQQEQTAKAASPKPERNIFDLSNLAWDRSISAWDPVAAHRDQSISTQLFDLSQLNAGAERPADQSISDLQLDANTAALVERVKRFAIKTDQNPSSPECRSRTHLCSQPALLPQSPSRRASLPKGWSAPSLPDEVPMQRGHPNPRTTSTNAPPGARSQPMTRVRSNLTMPMDCVPAFPGAGRMSQSGGMRRTVSDAGHLSPMIGGKLGFRVA